MKKTFYNIVINGIYQIFIILLPIITVPYVSRVLGRYYLGEYSFYNGLITFLGVIIVFSLNQLGTKTIAEADFKERRKKFENLWSLQLVIGSITILIYLAIVLLFFSGSKRIYWLLFLPALLSYVFDLSWFYIGISEIKKVVLRNTLIKIASLILIFTLVKSKNDFYLYILINSLGLLLSNAVFLISLKNYLPKKTSQFKLRIKSSLFKSGVILLIPQIAVQIYTSLDKVLIGSLAGQSQLSFYDQSQKIARLILAIVTSLSIVLMPKMAQMNKDKTKLVQLFQKSLNYTLAIAGFMAIVVMVNTKTFVPWFFGSEFTPMINNMFWSSLIIIFISYGGVFANQYALASGMFKAYSIPYVIGAIIDVSLNLILVPRLSSMGGTISLIVTEFFVCLIRIFLLKNELNLARIFNQQLGIYAAIIFTFIIGFLIRPSFGSPLLTMIASGLEISVIFIITILILDKGSRSDLRLVTKLIKNKIKK